jgi:hypothetical protein
VFVWICIKFIHLAFPSVIYVDAVVVATDAVAVDATVYILVLLT